MCFGGSKQPKVIQQQPGFGTPVDDPTMDSSRDARLRYKSSATQPKPETLGSAAYPTPAQGLGSATLASSNGG